MLLTLTYAPAAFLEFQRKTLELFSLESLAPCLVSRD